jgi:hypothetical protein
MTVAHFRMTVWLAATLLACSPDRHHPLSPEMAGPASERPRSAQTVPSSLSLAVLPSGAHGNGLNINGVAVGNGPSSDPCYIILPMLWRADGTLVVLPQAPYCGGSAQAINASGTVLGYLANGAPNAGGIWIPTDAGYVLQDLGAAPDGLHPIMAGGLNDANEVIGWAQGGPKLYWWSASTGWTSMQPADNATACQVYAGINNRGEIVGKCTVAGIQNGYYWASHTAAPVLLPRPTATSDISPRDINDSGVIVGYGPTGALRWTPPYVTVERLPDAGKGSVAYGIAADGTVVGHVVVNKSQPAYWPPSGGYKLLPLTSKGSWGEAMDAATTANGLVITGTDGNQKAIRWK